MTGNENRTTPATSRVARIPYLNAAPFYLRWPEIERLSEGRWTSTVLPPRQLGRAAEAGQVDAGLMAAADLFRLEESFEPLAAPPGPKDEVPPPAGDPLLRAGFGVASRERVDSVLLFVRNRRRTSASPPPAGAAETPGAPVLSAEDAATLHGKVVGVTQEPSTSIRLLRLLLEVRHGLRPAEYRRLELPERLEAPPLAETALSGPGIEEEAAAFLTIGDHALRWAHRPPEGFHLAADLAAEWRAWTGLPFVFAVWTARRSVAAEAAQWLGRFLDQSLAEAQNDLPHLVRDLPEDMGPPETLLAYLRRFTYRIGNEERAGLREFGRLLRAHDLLG